MGLRRIRLKSKQKGPTQMRWAFLSWRVLNLSARVNRDSSLTFGTFKGHDAIDEREKRVISSHADVWAWVELGATLSDDDRSGGDYLAPVSLDSESFRL
jgi:hypothetical protein